MLIPKKKIWVSWSSGKDSAYALHKIRESNEYEIVGLITTVTETFNRVSMHATRRELLEQQAKQLCLPLHLVLIPYPCTNEIYETQMQLALAQAVQQNISHIVFGDLFLEEVRCYRETTLATTGIQPLFPLWGKNTTVLAHEMIEAGMKAIITCVDTKKLDSSFAGRKFDKALLNDLPENVDSCAENGEFHTFVYDGPLFSNRIEIKSGEIVNHDGFIFADIIPMEAKNIS